MQVGREGPAANQAVHLRQSLQQVPLHSSAAMRPLNEPCRHGTVPTVTVACSNKAGPIMMINLNIKNGAQCTAQVS